MLALTRPTFAALLLCALGACATPPGPERAAGPPSGTGTGTFEDAGVAAFLDVCLPLDRGAAAVAALRRGWREVPLAAMAPGQRADLARQDAMLFGSRAPSGQGAVLLWTEGPRRCEVRLTRVDVEAVARRFERALGDLRASGRFDTLDVPPAAFAALEAEDPPDYRLRRAIVYTPRGADPAATARGLALRVAVPDGSGETEVTLAVQAHEPGATTAAAKPFARRAR